MKDPKVCRVSFHRPNLAFDVRKVAGEADKLRQLGKLIQRLRRPGIVYCATVRAVDELYVALRHGKIPVERYNGKMTTDEREKAQASFMQSGRKVVMLATNAFGLGIDKPDIRYIIHYQMPGSPESYVQEAGRAGRDGKPARCVLLFQPDDIAIQEHFLKEAHPTKSQARMVADGLYAWSDEGKEVSVRDLAMSMALPERRVRVILSVLEAMGVAEEVKAARWKGIEPRPTREQIDKAAIGLRGAADLRSAAAVVAAVVHEHAELPRADDAQLLRRARGRAVRAVRFRRGARQRGVRSRVGRRAARAARGHRLPRAAAATPAGTRRRLRGSSRHAVRTGRAGGAAGAGVRDGDPERCAAAAAGFRDSAARPTASRPSTKVCGRAPTRAPASRWRATRWSTWPIKDEGAEGPATAAEVPAAEGDGDFATGWAAIRDANIRPYVEWRAGVAIPLPVLAPRPVAGGGQGSHPGHHGHGTVGAAAAAVAVAAINSRGAAGPAAGSTAAARAVAAVGGGRSAVAIATATTTGAIITGTGIASAARGFPAFTIRAATKSPRCRAATKSPRCRAATKSPRCRAATSRSRLCRAGTGVPAIDCRRSNVDSDRWRRGLHRQPDRQARGSGRARARSCSITSCMGTSGR